MNRVMSLSAVCQETLSSFQPSYSERGLCASTSQPRRFVAFPQSESVHTNLADKNFEGDVKDKASIYVPAIGKVTIVMLLRNLLVSEHCECISESRLILRSDLSKTERGGWIWRVPP